MLNVLLNNLRFDGSLEDTEGTVLAIARRGDNLHVGISAGFIKFSAGRGWLTYCHLAEPKCATFVSITIDI